MCLPPVEFASEELSSGHLLVTASGEVDLASSAALRERIVGARRSLILDLQPCTFLDASAITAIVSAHQRLRRTACALVAIAPGGIARRTIDLSGLADAVPVVESRAAAVAAIDDLELERVR